MYDQEKYWEAKEKADRAYWIAANAESHENPKKDYYWERYRELDNVAHSILFCSEEASK